MKIHKLSLTTDDIKDAISMIRFKEIYLKDQKVEFIIPCIMHTDFTLDQIGRINKYAEQHNSVVLSDFPTPEGFDKTDKDQVDQVLSKYKSYIQRRNSNSFMIWYRLLEE